ncbi:hypothetical protein BpHYR1_027789 [Brachionus plicatilis]|uniref:Uncharacterized protein n=1 Tax=Brachionus plicatilis TaxID=10195 RepID=A0A3M7RV00_BRAPC|nr:hypothetical protein BpHYR1_027789 [Brachionus plicatilis]
MAPEICCSFRYASSASCCCLNFSSFCCSFFALFSLIFSIFGALRFNHFWSETFDIDSVLLQIGFEFTQVFGQWFGSTNFKIFFVNFKKIGSRILQSINDDIVVGGELFQAVEFYHCFKWNPSRVFLGLLLQKLVLAKIYVTKPCANLYFSFLLILLY